MEGLSFWDIVTRLLGETGSSPDRENRSQFEDKGKNRFIHMGSARIDELMRAFCRELVEFV